MAKFVERDQSQLYLLPVDMRDWVPDLAPESRRWHPEGNADPSTLNNPF